MGDVPNHPQNTVVTTHDALTSEVQHIQVKATGGTWDLKFDGEVASELAYNLTAPELQTALEGLSNVAPGDVVVTGGPGDATGTKPYVLTWAASEAEVDVPAPTTVATELEGSKEALVTTTTAGGDASDALQRGTGLADRTAETSALSGKTPVEQRAANSEDYE